MDARQRAGYLKLRSLPVYIGETDQRQDLLTTDRSKSRREINSNADIRKASFLNGFSPMSSA